MDLDVISVYKMLVTRWLNVGQKSESINVHVDGIFSMCSLYLTTLRVVSLEFMYARVEMLYYNKCPK